MNESFQQIEQLKVVPVISMPDAELALPLAEALREGGLAVAEITLRTPAAIPSIERMAGESDFLVGAGTIHSVDDAKLASDAGAAFIVTPGINAKTVEWCLNNNIPIVPGIATPTDLELALALGLTHVKFFPAEALGGITMLKALSSPYAAVKFMPTGGVNANNLANYLSLPCVAACGGSWIAKAELLADRRFAEIKELAIEAVSLAAGSG